MRASVIAWRPVLVAISAALIVGCSSFIGCSSSQPTAAGQKPVHPVNGQVTVGGQPAAGAFVLFTPVNEAPDATDARPRAEVQEDGSFAISTYGSEDGAPAGEYVVTIRWVDSEDTDRLQGRYGDPKTSTLRTTVKEGTNEVPLKL